tara:strand:+ start:41875 stop:42408 length:534 start_codon:yes stop_codon:yes gene_type:complete
MKNKNTKTKFGAFDRLFNEAFDDSKFFDDSEDSGSDILDDVEGASDEFGGEEEGEVDVTITLTADQVSVLKEIIAQLGDEDEGEGEEADEFGGDEGGEGIEDLEGLNEEAVESESAPDAETVRTKTKTGKAAEASGEWDKDSSTEDGEEKQYKFVKRVKPTEYKTKQTKGSSGQAVD